MITEGINDLFNGEDQQSGGMQESLLQGSVKRPLSVTALTAMVQELIEGTYPYPFWIEGEVSNYTRSRLGHIYFTLKDENSQIKAVFFKPHTASMKFAIEDGIKIVCKGRLGIYPARGEYQLRVEQVEQAGVGDLELRFRQLKERLYKEGLFDEGRKKPLPALPSAVGIVTSPTGAAVRDILQVLNRRYRALHVIIYPALVQGEGSAQQIAEGVQWFNRGKNSVDVIVVTRGGGSLEDLWAFNEEVLARAIFNSKIPVVSAVGHQVDFTISDFVADHRAPTPSAAAEIISPSEERLRQRIDFCFRHIQNRIKNVIPQYRQRIDDYYRYIYRGVQQGIQRRILEVNAYRDRLDALSPVNILRRGYSITMHQDGSAIKDINELYPEQIIKTLFKKGQISSVIRQVQEGNDEKLFI